METSNSSGKNSSSKSSPWLRLESGETAWEDFSSGEKQELVKHFAPKIKLLAHRLKAKLPQHVELGELISSGSLGLMEALGRFKPELSIKFDTFAESRIKGAMLDNLRRMDWFSRGLRHRMRELEEAIRKVEHETGSPATVEKVAKSAGLSVKEASEGLEMLQNQMCLSLDAIVENFSSFKKHQIDNEPYQSTAQKEIIDKLAGLIDELTEREQLVLSLYYADEFNMREVAEIMSITEGRVSQLHSQALGKLRQKFQERYQFE
ncbi:MAG: FliA/WhiG family RNA polymerase sigma factor [Desulfovibrionaceae bacterium]|nr:FliA/WhiG family RNA polymerase sigma factor [Desulfovibrionaceae bacterium]MBF0512747.1 FliA/WhiG family RNA polymerase sigma factor [Desulfovibrionaceae bacterium]